MKIQKLDEYKMARDVDEDTRELMDFEHENRDKINSLVDAVNKLTETKYLDKQGNPMPEICGMEEDSAKITNWADRADIKDGYQYTLTREGNKLYLENEDHIVDVNKKVKPLKEDKGCNNDGCTDPRCNPSTEDEGDLLEAAWGLIANASGGDWSKADPEWRDAARRWRDKYHKPPTEDEMKMQVIANKYGVDFGEDNAIGLTEYLRKNDLGSLADLLSPLPPTKDEVEYKNVGGASGAPLIIKPPTDNHDEGKKLFETVKVMGVTYEVNEFGDSIDMNPAPKGYVYIYDNGLAKKVLVKPQQEKSWEGSVREYVSNKSGSGAWDLADDYDSEIKQLEDYIKANFYSKQHVKECMTEILAPYGPSLKKPIPSQSWAKMEKDYRLMKNILSDLQTILDK